MKTNRPPSSAASGFTLVEVAIATGIAAGVLAILTMVVGALSSDVQRLKPYEASKRRAFVNSGAPPSTPSSSSTSTTPPADTTPSTPAVSLPDANLDPSKRPDASQPPPDPNAPPPTPTPDPTSGTTGASGTSSP